MITKDALPERILFLAAGFFLLFSLPSFAQRDSITEKLFTEQQLLAVVRSWHPVVKQAEYGVQRSNAAITSARGNFDPLLDASFERKKFDGTTYYSYYKPELIIPTWYGVEVYAGAEEISGSRVNAESTLGQTSYLGVSVPLLKDLVIDKRRATLQQAKTFLQQSKAERDNIVNDLLFDALGAYWNWVREYRIYQLFTNIIRLNEDRFRFVRIEYQQGNRPAIDTAEALAQLQSFQFLQNEAQLKFRNAGLELSNYLWLQNETPYQLPPDIVPDSVAITMIDALPLPVLDTLLDAARLRHPKLRANSFKIDWLQIEQKLKFQGLLPKLDVKANLLNKGYNVFSKVNTTFLENNYKYGISFSLPLRLSQGRGEYRQAKLKVSEATLEQKMLGLQIENKVRSYFNEVLALRQQIKINEGMLLNYDRLLRGEEARFRIGESSLFLVNTRENKVLESMQKLVELKTKLYKSYAGLQWAAGLLQ